MIKYPVQNISAKEWRWLAGLSLALIIITAAPYVYGWRCAPAGTVYDGLGSLTPGDNPVYYSYINQAASGSLTLKVLFTGEKQTGGLFNIFWLVAGWFGRFFHLTPVIAFHLLRLLLIPAYLAVVYVFAAWFFADIYRRRLALILFSFGSGLGAYFYLPLSLLDMPAAAGFWMPNDIWIPESLPFLSMYKTPHFIFSQLLMVAIFLLMIAANQRRRWRYALAGGLAALVYFNFHPFYIPLIFGVAGLYYFFLCRREKKIIWPLAGYLLTLAAVSSPSIVYHFYELSADPVLGLRALQNQTIAPPFIFIIIGYGMLWPLALWGLHYYRQKHGRNDKFLFIAAMLAFSVLAVIIPTQFQSRYTQGLMLPLSILAAAGWPALKERWLASRRFSDYHFIVTDKIILAAIFLVLLSFTNVFNVIRDVYYFAAKPGKTAEYFFLPKPAVAAMKFTAGWPEPKVVLAAQMSSLFIPVYSQNRVYCAHPIETLDYFAKYPYQQWFFRNDQDAEMKEKFLKNNNIDYVFFGPEERALGSFNPENKSWLRPVYDQGGVKIYAVL